MRIANRSVPHYGEEGFDRQVIFTRSAIHASATEEGVYGVFDGVGTSPGARRMANHASYLLRQGAEKDYVQTFDDLITILMGANIAADPQSSTHGIGLGASTATAIVIRHNELHYAHCGDSRLYVQKGGHLFQVTADEGYGNQLSNHLGPSGKGIFQFGVILDWERFMLCTDGITGDWPEQFIDHDDLMTALDNPDLEAAADEVLNLSTKPDDKTLIIGSAQ